MLLPQTRIGELLNCTRCGALSLRAQEESARRERTTNRELQTVNRKSVGSFIVHRLSTLYNFQFSIFIFLFHLVSLAFVVSSATAQVKLPEVSSAEPILITAQAGNQWQVGAYEVWVLRGDCVIQQGQAVTRGREAVLWIDRPAVDDKQPCKVIAYLEGDVESASSQQPGAPRLTDKTWFGRFLSMPGIQVRTGATAGKPDVLPPIYWRGMERRSPESAEDGWRPRVQPAQYVATPPGQAPGPVARPDNVTAPADTSAFPSVRPGALPAMAPTSGMTGPAVMAGGGRRIRVFPRSDVPVQAQWFPDPSSNQWIAVIDSGVNVIVDGLVGSSTLDISTDRLVIWTKGLQEPDLTGRTSQDQRTPLEFYMEGNIVFRQGERIIYAKQMYYDVPNHVGTVLDADVLTPVRNYAGLLRLHANVLQQTAEDRFFAKEAFLTSSRFGEPSYRLQTNDLYFEDIQHPLTDPNTGQPIVDPATGQPVIEHQRLATADNNFIFAGPVPIFYWPRLATDLNDPTYYIRNAAVNNDTVFGTQILTRWSGYDLLGIRNKPVGTDLDVRLDYLSDRGFGYGGTFTYDRNGLFDLPDHITGLGSFWGIQDRGSDNLGVGRRNVPLEESYRYRLFWQHRQNLSYDLQLSAELGWISDRNFLEEYYKREWDGLKDESTGVELKRIHDNTSWSITADYRLNDFFTQTNWLPRADHFWLGQPLMNDAFTWYEHSNAAYAQFKRTTVPDNVSVGPVTGAAGPFNYLPWEVDSREGERLATRQEIDWPFQLGAVKVVPYMLGELAHWGQDVNGEPLDRAWGQVGVRASMPMWSVDPTANSDLFNVHGIAHKVVFDAEFMAADSNRNMSDLPLYDPLDDDSIEAWRRQFLTSTFGLPSMMLTPTGQAYLAKFDERYYALRSGLQSWVTSPSTEVADDLMAIQLGAHQKWQTKRGPAHNRRIIDWVTLDTNISIFPDAGRDNYNTTAGLFDYDFAWHVGDRLTLVSNGIFDFFSQGQTLFSFGGYLTRPPRGSLYMGFRVLEGPINSQVLSVSYTYWMSPKWTTTFGTSYDFGNQGNIGQNFSITRIGESFLVSAGFSVDASRNNVGVGLMVEPRFSKGRMSTFSGAEIPPAGAMGLE